MDISEKQAILAALFFAFAGSASAFSFDISVEEDFNYDIQSLEYSQNVTDLQSVNTSIMNTGSVPCRFRLKTVFNTSEEQLARKYSDLNVLQPGQYGFLNTYYFPENKGNSSATVYVKGCNGWEKIGNESFNVQEVSEPDDTIKFSKKYAEKGLIKVDMEENLQLVPTGKPPYWKVSPAEVINGTAKLRYQPESYSPEKNITYVLFNKSSGELSGSMSVSVETKKPLLQKIDMTHLLVLLVASVLLNLLLGYRAFLNSNQT